MKKTPMNMIIWCYQQEVNQRFYGVTGAEEHTFKLWSYDDAVLLKKNIF